MNGKRRRSSELSTYGTYYLYTITTYKLHKNTTTTEPLQYDVTTARNTRSEQ